jgi:hypothetical protein
MSVHPYEDLKSRIMIDDKGEAWAADGSDLVDHFKSALPITKLIDYVVTNLGWIEIRTSASMLLVRCRPMFVSQPAAAGMFFYLADHANLQLTLSVLSAKWQHFVGVKLQHAFAIVEALQGGAGTVENRFLATRRSADSSPLAKRFGDVLGRKAQTHESLSILLAKSFTNQRWTISHFDDSDRLVLDERGSGFTPFNAQWSSTGKAAPLVDYAGPEYATWIAAGRRDVAQRGEVVFDDVDATVEFPEIGTSRLHYTRATAPVRLASGQPVIISAAEPIATTLAHYAA